MDEFFNTVGAEPSIPYPKCPAPKCNKRIVHVDSELDLTLLCPNCFEHYVATEEEIAHLAMLIARLPERSNHRRKLKEKYGSESEPWWVYEQQRTL